MKIKCKCGCGMEREQFDNRGRERFYIKGHHIGNTTNCWNKGKKGVYSKETLEKMRLKKLGIKVSEKTKEKMKNSAYKIPQEERKIRKKARWKSNDNISIKPCCEICGSTENLEKHHWDYNRPLLVSSLCKECHSIQHIKNFTQSKYAGGIIA